MMENNKKIVNRWESDAFENKEVAQKIFVDLKKKLRYSPHPISGWKSDPNQKYETLEINSHGLRNKDFKLLDQNNQNCMLLGGSVAWGFGATSNQNIPSSQIEKFLKEKHKIKLNVINFAEQMHSSHEELMTFIGYIDEIKPKYIICLTGTNDINRGNLNLFKYTDLNNTWLNLFNKAKSMKIINEKNILKYLLKNILRFNNNYQKVNENNFVFKKPSRDNIPIQLLRNKIEIINSICEKKNIFVMHILQPDLIFKKHKTDSELKYLNFLNKDREEYVKKHIGILREYLNFLKINQKNNKINYLDLNEVFDDVTETIFFDKAHLNDKGYEILSKKIAYELRKNFF
jgi:lysophospholipase L1-like esterase